MNPNLSLSTRIHNKQVSLLIVLFVLTVGGTIGVAGKGFESRTSPEVDSTVSISVTRPTTPQQTKPAEEVYKNIQVFKGLPASELDSTMAFISGSLGVRCNYCHVNPFEKDDRLTKRTARQMIRMVLDLNKGSFSGQKAVSCFTCHRGKPQPVSVPAVGQNLWQSNAEPPKESSLPTVDEILAKYVQALGGEHALQKVTSRIAKGSRIGADGVLVPEDVYQKAPNKLLTVTTYPDVVFSTGFNGIVGWGLSSKGGSRELSGPILAQLKSDSEFYKEIRTKDLYRKFVVTGKSNIRGTDVYVVDATPMSGMPEKLFFDAGTGLLLRRYQESEVFLGRFPLQTDYEDYREVDGIKQPFLIHWSMPGRIWGRKITEIKQNETIDDAQFNPPSSKP